MKKSYMGKAILAISSLFCATQSVSAHDLWVISTMDDNFAEYEIPSDPNDKSYFKKFIKYQEDALVKLEKAAAEYLSNYGLEYKVARKFDNLGILALEIIEPVNNEDSSDNNSKVETLLAKAKKDTPPPFYIYKNRQIKLDYIADNNNVSKIKSSDLRANFVSNFPSAGENTNIFILDTGIRDTHKEFLGHNVIMQKGSKTYDGHGHGTHVAGTATGNRVGFATKANLYVSKVLSDDGYGDDISIFDGLDWVVDRCSEAKGHCVLSMSLGGGKQELENKIMNTLDRLGVLVVVAAGNESDDACEYSPASASGAFSVASANVFSNKMSYFSNYGSCVNIIADGENVVSAWHDRDSSYKAISGTSMATPTIAGISALVWSEYPNVMNQELKWYLVSMANTWILGYPFVNL